MGGPNQGALDVRPHLTTKGTAVHKEERIDINIDMDTCADVDCVSYQWAKAVGLKPCRKNQPVLIRAAGRKEAETRGAFWLRLTIPDSRGVIRTTRRPYLALDRDDDEPPVLVGMPGLQKMRIKIDLEPGSPSWEYKLAQKVKVESATIEDDTKGLLATLEAKFARVQRIPANQPTTPYSPPRQPKPGSAWGAGPVGERHACPIVSGALVGAYTSRAESTGIGQGTTPSIEAEGLERLARGRGGLDGGRGTEEAGEYQPGMAKKKAAGEQRAGERQAGTAKRQKGSSGNEMTESLRRELGGEAPYTARKRSPAAKRPRGLHEASC